MLAYLWITVEIAAVVTGTYAVQRPVGAYERVDGALSAIGVDQPRYERLSEDESEELVLIGSLLIGLGILAAVLHQRAGGRRALTAGAGEIIWLDRITERAGPKLRSVLESSGEQRRQYASELRRTLLVVGSTSWGGEDNEGDARLAYYRIGTAGSSKTLTRESQYPDDTGFPETFSHPKPPTRLVTGRRRFGRYWSDELQPIPTLRAAALAMPVGSPLEHAPAPFGIIIIDVPKKRRLNRGSTTAARLLSAWLGATDLAARGATK